MKLAEHMAQKDRFLLEMNGKKEDQYFFLQILVATEVGKKRQYGKQNQTLACPARQVIFWAESLQCNSPLCNSGRAIASGASKL